MHTFVTAYTDAAAATVDLVARIDPGLWSSAGLGEWDLRALVGHTSRALVTVLDYMDRPARTEDVPSPEAYYALPSDPRAVAERGRQAGLPLGDDPASAFRDLAKRAVARVRSAERDSLIQTIAGGMRVRCYVPTRTVELVVHGLDIAAATGLPVALSGPATAEAASVLARIAVARGQGPELLMALTGRGSLSPGFTVV